MWIAKDKKMIDQVKFTASNDEVSGTLRITMYDFNKPVAVQKPAGAKSVLELLSDLYGGQESGEEVLEQLQTNGISL
jgi:hypothetical protein